MFTPYFLAFSATLIQLAMGTTAANWRDFTQDLPRLYRLSAIPLFLIIGFLVGSVHELAHGLTCTYFGGEVHEVGFMLIYLQPALYCNVSDAWLFPEKSKRLLVGLAGPYFELFLWALGTIAWRLTDVETWINYLALVVMASSGIKTLLNFNPFIKLDGYYLLSDYLEIPNLRRKSFRYVGSLIQRLFGRGAPAGPDLSPRQRMIYFIYGFMATASSFSILGYVLVTAGGYLIDRRQPAAVLLSVALVGMKFHRRFRRLFGPSGKSDVGDEGDGLDTDTWNASVVDQNAEPANDRAEPANKPDRSWPRRIAWSVVAAAALAFLILGHLDLRVSGPFSILPVENADVRASVEGIIEKISVDEGDHVNRGDLIARLSDKDLLPTLRQTEAQIRETRAKLQMLVAGPTTEEIAVVKAAVSKGKDQYRYAQNQLARLTKMFEQHLIPRKDFEDAQQATTKATDDLTDATSRLNALLKRTRPEEIDATRAQMERLETQRHYLSDQLQRLNIVSPSTGVIATPSRQLREMVGRLVKKGDLIVKVIILQTATAQILVSEKEIDGVALHQPVVLRTRAYPSQTFYGTVTSIATVAGFPSGANNEAPTESASPRTSTSANPTIVVTTEIANQSLLLKPEMTGEAKILCGRRRVLDLIGRRLARTFKVEVWSWW